MSAEHHKRTAKDHEAEAQIERQKGELARDAEVRVLHPGAIEDDFIWSRELYEPSITHFNEAQEHRKHAAEHERAARALEKFEENQCKKFPSESRPSCPLMGQLKSVESIDGGVTLRFKEGVPLGAVADHIRCHFAYARTRAFEGMPECPIYLKGIEVEEGKDHVTLKSTDKDTLREVLKLSRAHLPDEGGAAP